MLPALPLFFLVPCAAAQELGEDPPPPPPVWEELLRLRARLEALERDRSAEGQDPSGEVVAIDLSGDELASVAPNTEHVLSRPWYENVQLGGYAALSYLDTGGTGTTEEGSILVREASLFLDAQVWERAFLFTEIWLARYQFGNGFNLGEIHLLLTGLGAADGEPGIGLKAGRFEIPFGEEYLRWDANESPWISFTAGDPYGIDEGLELYGELGPVGWVAALTNGNAGSPDDGTSKLVCAKLYGEPSPALYLSGSVLALGDTEASALRFGGSSIRPVGSDGPSSTGASPSSDVDSLCWELDARLRSERAARLNLQLGGSSIDDEVGAFDRDLTWFLIEPGLRISPELELALRWSEIGTYDDDEGYQFQGKPLTAGDAFGYDTRALRRASGVLAWSLHPRLTLKLEVGQDHVDLIDASTLDDENDERLYFAFEVVGSF
jgi:hypothetical protein